MYSNYMEQLRSPRTKELFEEHKTVHLLQVIHKLREEYQSRKVYEISAFGFALLGIILMLVENEVIMFHPISDPSPVAAEILKGAVSLSTIVLCTLIIFRYKSHTTILRLQNVVPPESSTFQLYWPKLLLELLICGFHIPPGIVGSKIFYQFQHIVANSTDLCEYPKLTNVQTTIIGPSCYMTYQYRVETLGVFMVLRLYLFGRYMRSSSPLYSQWASFIGALKNVNAMNPFFHFKAIFNTQPLRLVVPLLCLLTFITAAIVRILEVPAQPVLLSYWTSIWMTVVTITSVGYGDYTPITYGGRTFMAFTGILGGLLMLSLVQSIFFGALELTHNEQRVKYIIDHSVWDKKGREIAASLIQTQWRLKQLYKTDPDSIQHKTRQETLKFYRYMDQMHTYVRGEPVKGMNFEEEMDAYVGGILREIDALSREEEAVVKRIRFKLKEFDSICDEVIHKYSKIE